MRVWSSLLIGSLVYSCNGDLPQPKYGPQPTSALEEVPYPPPPPRGEILPPRPASGSVWIDGEWSMRAGRWAWKPGRWVMPPEGAYFARWTTARGDDGTLYYAPGAFRDAKGVEVPAPAPLAVAESTSGAIPGPEGELEKPGPNLPPEGRVLDSGAPETESGS